MNFFKTTLMVSSIALFTACGGGGGSSNTNTYDLQTYIDTASLAINLEGTINGVETVGTSYSTYLGIVDTPIGSLNVHETIIIINGVAETSYGGSYLGNIYAIEGSARNCYLRTGVTPTPVPQNATIGYVSDVVPLTCSDGATAEVSLSLESGGGDNALVVATTKLYTAGGVLVSQSLSLVNPSMRLLEYDINIGGVALLHSTSIQQN